MRNRTIILSMLAMAAFMPLLSSCRQKQLVFPEGTVNLNISLDGDPATKSTTEELLSSCSINIYNSDGQIRSYTGTSSLPSQLNLIVGSYRVDVAAGTKSLSSFTDKYYTGSTPFDVTSGATSDVAVKCTLADAAVAVTFDPTVAAQYAKSYNVTIGPSSTDRTSALTFDSSTGSKVGYYYVDPDGTSLYWTFTGTAADGTVTTKSGVIDDVVARDKYDVTFKYTHTPEGILSFTITVDESTLAVDDVINFVADPTGALAVNSLDVWATKCTIAAAVDEGSFSGKAISFQYRQSGSSTWSTASATRSSENYYTALVSSLSAETSYEFQLLVDGTAMGEVRTFTTDEAPQMPNEGFETWSYSESSKYPSPFASTSEKWWDNGNKGSATASVVISESSTDCHEGSYSAKLTSQGVFGIKIAAGNIFTGSYGSTNISTQSGTVYFGRPFTARPTALHGWYKYNCGTIDYVGSSTAGASKGDKDRGRILILLGDWNPSVYGGTSTSPVLVDTGNATYLSADSDAVIAKGELVQQSTVSGWTEFTIPLTYVTTSRRPTHIIVMCTSSYLGDYFTGSSTSLMYVDDFSLVY
jgi:hypothetical protein